MLPASWFRGCIRSIVSAGWRDHKYAPRQHTHLLRRANVWGASYQVGAQAPDASGQIKMQAGCGTCYDLNGVPTESLSWSHQEVLLKSPTIAQDVLLCEGDEIWAGPPAADAELSARERERGSARERERERERERRERKRRGEKGRYREEKRVFGSPLLLNAATPSCFHLDIAVLCFLPSLVLVHPRLTCV